MHTNLATKFTVLAFSIAVLGFLNGLAALAFTRLTANSMRSAVIESIPRVRAAQELDAALLDQKGLVSAYIFPDGTPQLLELSRKAEAEFADRLPRAKTAVHTAEERAALDAIETAFAGFTIERNKAILQFNQGQRKEAVFTLVHEVWPAYDDADKLCAKLVQSNEAYVATSVKRAEGYVAIASWGVLIGSLGTALLAAFLAWQIVRRFIVPLRQMVTEARHVVGHDSAAASDLADDEIRSIGVYFRALMADVAEQRTTLEENRSRLLNMDKLASLGKLAASVAHEMRNPLSSMKMWLYSIRKAAGTEPSLDRKYQILSDEITRLENIVRNVLEFSKPFTLKLQPRCIIDVIDKTLEAVRPGLETKNIRLVQQHLAAVPQVMADADQLKQVFVILLDNAAAAMPEGGQLTISWTTEADRLQAANVVVRIRDTGVGIPEDVQSRLFEPFFTTKEEGTGLGLCIAANIMARHGGKLILESSTANGSTFAVRLPIAAENRDGQNPSR